MTLPVQNDTKRQAPRGYARLSVCLVIETIQEGVQKSLETGEFSGATHESVKLRFLAPSVPLNYWTIFGVLCDSEDSH